MVIVARFVRSVPALTLIFPGVASKLEPSLTTMKLGASALYRNLTSIESPDLIFKGLKSSTLIRLLMVLLHRSRPFRWLGRPSLVSGQERSLARQGRCTAQSG